MLLTELMFEVFHLLSNPAMTVTRLQLIIDNNYQFLNCPCVCRMYYKIIVYTLTRKSYAVRNAAQRKVRKMIGSLSGAQTALALINEFRQLLAIQKVLLLLNTKKLKLLLHYET
jgi:hypothetical protein